MPPCGMTAPPEGGAKWVRSINHLSDKFKFELQLPKRTFEVNL